jgi:hypothetical protein
MRQAIVALFGFLALVSLATGASAQTSYHSAPLGITFPAELGGFRFVRTTDFEQRQRGLGTGVYYNHQAPFIAVDIFIYDKTERVPSGHEPAAIVAEAQQALADIHAVAASGLYADVKVHQGPTACRAGGGVYQCVSLDYLRTPKDQPAVPTRSLLLVTGVKGNYVKLRASWPQESHAQAEPIVDRWLAAFAKLLPAN